MKKVNLIFCYSIIIILLISSHAVITNVVNIYFHPLRKYEEWTFLIMGLSFIILIISFLLGIIKKDDLKYENDVIFLKYIDFWIFLVQLALSISLRFCLTHLSELGVPHYLTFIILLSPTWVFIIKILYIRSNYKY